MKRCCGKLIYATEDQAKDAVKHLLRRNGYTSRFLVLAPYRCHKNNGFHIGNHLRGPNEPMQDKV